MLASEPPQTAPRIVILDPGSPNGVYARECLETLGLPVGLAGTDLELLDALHAAPPDLLILDGDEARSLAVVRDLKSRASTLLVPVLAVCSDSSAMHAALVAGADEQVTRAAGPRGLLALAEVLLEQGDVRRQMTEKLVRREERLKERLRSTFSRYLAPQLADRILADLDAGESGLKPERTTLRAAVMFADMRGFTSMAERLSPDDTVEVLNEYFAALAEIALRHGGTIYSMSGDSLMIGYGVPDGREDGPQRAITAAREMLAGFRNLAGRWHDRHGISVGLGIGVNDGHVLAGDVGSERFMSYTMIGDTVNVASRLSQRARAGEMLFSGSVKQSLDRGGYEIRALALPPLTLRGRSTPLDIFCVPLEERLHVDA